MNRNDIKERTKIRKKLTQEDFKKILEFSKFRIFINKNKTRDPIIFYVRIGYTKIFSFITKNKNLYRTVREDLFSRPLDKGLSDFGYNINLSRYSFFVYGVLDQKTFLERIEQDLVNLRGRYPSKFDNTLLDPELEIDRKLLVH